MSCCQETWRSHLWGWTGLLWEWWTWWKTAWCLLELYHQLLTQAEQNICQGGTPTDRIYHRSISIITDYSVVSGVLWSVSALNQLIVNVAFDLHIYKTRNMKYLDLFKGWLDEESINPKRNSVVCTQLMFKQLLNKTWQLQLSVKSAGSRKTSKSFRQKQHRSESESKRTEWRGITPILLHTWPKMAKLLWSVQMCCWKMKTSAALHHRRSNFPDMCALIILIAQANERKLCSTHCQRLFTLTPHQQPETHHWNAENPQPYTSRTTKPGPSPDLHHLLPSNQSEWSDRKRRSFHYSLGNHLHPVEQWSSKIAAQQHTLSHGYTITGNTHRYRHDDPTYTWCWCCIDCWNSIKVEETGSPSRVCTHMDRVPCVWLTWPDSSVILGESRLLRQRNQLSAGSRQSKA